MIFGWRFLLRCHRIEFLPSPKPPYCFSLSIPLDFFSVSLQVIAMTSKACEIQLNRIPYVCAQPLSHDIV